MFTSECTETREQKNLKFCRQEMHHGAYCYKNQHFGLVCPYISVFLDGDVLSLARLSVDKDDDRWRPIEIENILFPLKVLLLENFFKHFKVSKVLNSIRKSYWPYFLHNYVSISYCTCEKSSVLSTFYFSFPSRAKRSFFQ